MSRLLVALALVLAACTAPVEPADPVEACVAAYRRGLTYQCDVCGSCVEDTDEYLREACASLGDDARGTAIATNCTVDCREEHAACESTPDVQACEMECIEAMIGE